MLCKIFLHLCEVFLTFFVHNCDLRAECLYIFCCAKDSCKMLFSCTYGNVYKTFCYFLSSIALVLFACQWGENKEGKSLEQPLEMLLKMIGGEVVGGVPPPLAWSWWGLEREKVKPHYPPSRGFFLDQTIKMLCLRPSGYFIFSLYVWDFACMLLLSTGAHSVTPYLAWNSIIRPGWLRTQRSTCLCFSGVGIKDMSHYADIWIIFLQVNFWSDQSKSNCPCSLEGSGCLLNDCHVLFFSPPSVVGLMIKYKHNI